MKTFLISLFSFFTLYIQAQDLFQFNQQQQKMNGIGMTILGSWAIGNVAWGVSGLNNTNAQYANFSQMNLSWGAINLGLALPGYLRSKRTFYSEYDLKKTYSEQIKLEKIFLANGMIDIAYMTFGGLLLERAKWDTLRKEQLTGFGQSIIMQGAFLFVFDLAMTYVHAHHRKKSLDVKLSIN
jgi:hypothetical protein